MSLARFWEILQLDCPRKPKHLFFQGGVLAWFKASPYPSLELAPCLISFLTSTLPSPNICKTFSMQEGVCHIGNGEWIKHWVWNKHLLQLARKGQLGKWKSGQMKWTCNSPKRKTQKISMTSSSSPASLIETWQCKRKRSLGLAQWWCTSWQIQDSG